MQFSFSTYIAGDTPIHRLDARVKIALLLTYAVTLFLIDTWAGMASALVLAALATAVPRIGAGSMAKLLSPAFVLAALLVVANAFVFAAPHASGGEGELIALVGTFYLSIDGLGRGLFLGLRVVLLVWVSLVVGLTTTSTELMAVARWALSPLRALKVPVDDIATIFSIALRFIPLTAEEFCRIRNAQWSRGCRFADEGLLGRVRSWGMVLMPLLMALFRRADDLAVAMDARCYGAVENRASLRRMKMNAASACALFAGVALCAALAYLL